MGRDDGQWHWDKTIPLGFLLMIAAQTITLVYVGTTWKTGIDNRLDNLERAEIANAPTSNRITILEQQFGFITSTLKRIEDKLDRGKP